ncbi:hypothetical protein D3C80_1639120 [compost metagenome]
MRGAGACGQQANQRRCDEGTDDGHDYQQREVLLGQHAQVIANVQYHQLHQRPGVHAYTDQCRIAAIFAQKAASPISTEEFAGEGHQADQQAVPQSGVALKGANIGAQARIGKEDRQEERIDHAADLGIPLFDEGALGMQRYAKYETADDRKYPD